MHLAKCTRAYVGLRLRELDLAVGQDEVLIALEEYDSGTTISTVAQLTDVRPTTVSKVIDKLWSRQLVERYISSADKRCTIVRLSPKGREYVQKIHAIYQDIDREIERANSSYVALEARQVIDTLGDAVQRRLLRIRV